MLPAASCQPRASCSSGGLDADAPPPPPPPLLLLVPPQRFAQSSLPARVW
jgi:hypothetical protein